MRLWCPTPLPWSSSIFKTDDPVPKHPNLQPAVPFRDYEVKHRRSLLVDPVTSSPTPRATPSSVLRFFVKVLQEFCLQSVMQKVFQGSQISGAQSVGPQFHFWSFGIGVLRVGGCLRSRSKRRVLDVGFCGVCVCVSGSDLLFCRVWVCYFSEK